MLTKIELRNFKKHKSTVFDLPVGLTSITGPNAAGKSTVLRAALYALFGATAAGAKAHLWNWDCGKEEAYVVLHLTLPKWGPVVIKRSDKSASVTGSELLASGHSAVTAFVEESLGLDTKSLQMLMYSPQGEAQGLLAMGATALQKRVEEISKLDVIDKILAFSAADLKEIEGKLWGLPDTANLPQLVNDLETSHQAQERLTVEVAEQESSILGLKEELRLAHTGLKIAREAEVNRKLLEARMEVLVKNKEQTEESIKATKESLSDIPSDIETIAAAAKEHCTTAREKRQSAATALSEVVRYSEALPKRIAEVERLNGLTDINQQAKQELTSVQFTLTEVQVAFDAALKTVSEAKAAQQTAAQAVNSATCPTCKREMGKGHVKHAEAALVAAQAKYETASAIYSDARARLDAVKKQEAALLLKISPNLEEELQQATVALQKVEDFLAKLPDPEEAKKLFAQAEAEEEQATQAWNTTYVQLNRYQDGNKRLKQYEKSLTEQNYDIAVCLDSLLAVPEPVDISVLELHVKDLQIQVDLAWGIYQEKHTRLTELKANVSALTSKVEEMQKASESRHQLEVEQAGIEGLQGYLRKNRSRLSSDVWEGLLSYASSLLNSTTSGWLSGIERTTGGDFTVMESGRSVPVTELSGAQRSMVGLCLRVAMTGVFYGGGLSLLLDEVSADMTNENAAAVAGMLQGLGHQVVMVTHRSGDAVNGQQIVELEM